MSFPHAVVLLALICVFAAAASAASAKGPLLKADFETTPRKAGWQTGADRGEFRGAWAKAVAQVEWVCTTPPMPSKA